MKESKPKKRLKHIKCFRFLNDPVFLPQMEIHGTKKHKQTKMYARNKQTKKPGNQRSFTRRIDTLPYINTAEYCSKE